MAVDPARWSMSPGSYRRLEAVEAAVKQLIDYTISINLLAIAKGLWTMEEFNRTYLQMDKERKVLADLGHDAGMKILLISKDLAQFKPKGEEKKP